MKKAGFTLIELLVIISIISLISSIAFASLNAARVRAKDTANIAEVTQVKKALTLFQDTNNKMPANYSCDSSGCTANLNVSNTTPAVEGTSAFNASMQELVDGGYLPSIPSSGTNGTFFYYNNLAAGNNNAVFGAHLLNSYPVNIQSRQCAWTSNSNFDAGIVSYQDTSNFRNVYFMNSISCTSQLTGPQDGNRTYTYPTTCNDDLVNPAYSGKCIVEFRQYWSRYGQPQLPTYYGDYAGHCFSLGFGPVVRNYGDQRPVTTSDFSGYSAASASPLCASASDNCACN